MTFARAHDPVGVPAPIGGYTNAVEVQPSRQLFISGQIPQVADGTVPTDAEQQCRLIWSHITACLNAADMTLDDLVHIRTYLSERSIADINTRVRHEVLGDHRPALTVLIAGIFDARWLLEIEAVAAAGPAITPDSSSS